MKAKWQWLLRIVTITIASVWPGSPNVFAQDYYQDKTIRFIVGQAAGGGYDTYTRTIAREMRSELKQN